MKAVTLIDKTSTKIEEITKPSPEKGEVLVKVAYSALDTAFEEVARRTFIPGGLLHNLKVKPLVAGWHYSGTVESVAAGVDDWKVGDAVFGHLQYASATRQGSLAEYITVPASECAEIPEGVTMDAAAAVATEALTALQGMRDQGGLSEGKSILIIAAGGGVGTQAVQIAKVMKAGAVHAVCSTKDVAKVKKLGANLVIDRTIKDIASDLEAASYDVIFDTSGKYSFMKLRYALKKKGSLVSTIPSISTLPPFSSFIAISGKRSKALMVHCNRKDLELVGTWIKTGEIHSIPIDKVYNIKNFEDARERQNDSKKSGRVVIKVQDGW
eukprot:CAMPEP_0172561968 /NCGR_PEP_ID=MMETSP1067-20121228/95052_1 /TAXON_ID=265564 ORGANISM="Thalassiosira punctigera, Strain Tpunct2005C2" /NCGR_SAMPLE_ID=MMETSP1067 /ASSEMBLY_ACC=CAM_ASM_000444 /LENGTH=325 /DNA_ID=CAMNT_0013352111 /DNA_START=225 /DNA_END=1202 /DNA_ORIENTATION=+